MLTSFVTDDSTATGVGVCAGLLILVITIRWDLRNRVWFWVIVLLAIPWQIPFLLWVPWERWRYTTFLPVGTLDIGVVLACIFLVEKVIEYRRPTRISVND